MQTLHIAYPWNRLAFPHKEDSACVVMVALLIFIAWACGAEVCFFEDTSQKAKKKEVEEGHLTSI